MPGSAAAARAARAEKKNQDERIFSVFEDEGFQGRRLGRVGAGQKKSSQKAEGKKTKRTVMLPHR